MVAKKGSMKKSISRWIDKVNVECVHSGIGSALKKNEVMAFKRKILELVILNLVT